MKEALADPKTWLFAFYGGFAALIGGIGVQYSLLIKSFGFTTLQTSLLSIPNGVAQIIGITTACYALRKFPVRFLISFFSFYVFGLILFVYLRTHVRGLVLLDGSRVSLRVLLR